MKAGFAKANINPPIGAPMMGFGPRDESSGCTGIHDTIFCRALYLEQEGRAALVMGLDLCFLGRRDVDRFKGAIGRFMDLSPRQILLNTSHTHVGPAVGTWYDAHPDPGYVDRLQDAVVLAACEAKAFAKDATVWVGQTRSRLPMDRRKVVDGEMTLAPNPFKPAFDHVPICLLRDLDDEPICLLFSVACHPSMMGGHEISAEYPGVAMARIDGQLGTDAAMFLQGCGGDAKPSVVGDGEQWRSGSWEEMEEAGGMVADEVLTAYRTGLTQVEPRLRAAALEVDWPLDPPLSEAQYEAIGGDPQQPEVRRLWAQRIVDKLHAHEPLLTVATITVQGVQVGENLRLVGLEGEAVGGWGKFIKDSFPTGVTFPMGYCNGEGLYLPTSEMLSEGGYEVHSYWEYGYPAQLSRGFENTLRSALKQLSAMGVE